jgi:hypothetical protein
MCINALHNINFHNDDLGKDEKTKPQEQCQKKIKKRKKNRNQWNNKIVANIAKLPKEGLR